MKWMTKEYVLEQAAISDPAALLCSIEHYDQMLAANLKKLNKAWEEKEVGIVGTHCALCQRHQAKGTCPMKPDCGGRCFEEYTAFGAASPFVYNIIGGVFYSKDSGKDWSEIRATMLEVRRVLQEKYDELYPKKAEPKEGFVPVSICLSLIHI